MSLSMLVMGPELEAEVSRIREHADKPENLYRPGQPIPGDDPAFVLHSGHFKVVYSRTQGPGTPVFRHLSVSTSHAGRYPSVVVVATLCHLFGFTGAPLSPDGTTATGLGRDWVYFKDGGAIAVQQVLREQ